MNENTYFALTIGPIYKTMAMARKTRELWAASYFFSYLMEQLVTSPDLEGELVLPARSAIKNSKAGLYPDHLIVKNCSYSSAKELFDNTFNDIIEKLPGTASAGRTTFFEDYFQLYALEIALPDTDDPIKTILPLLDSMEQKAAYVPVFATNYLKDVFENIGDWEKYREVFGKENRFPSVLEISSGNLKRLSPLYVPELIKDFEPKKEVFNRIFDFCLYYEGQEKNNVLVKDSTAISLLKEAYNPVKLTGKEDDQFRFYHKYMAIVQADGDNLSRALHAFYCLGGIAAVQEFSGVLMGFGKDAMELIGNEGGTPIYLGGDDLLFFAPVIGNTGTIFHLVRDLEKLFGEKINGAENLTRLRSDWNDSITKENKRERVDLSISFGISIGYHKFPLMESLETARELLFEEAKMLPGKNAVSFRLLKHSGQYFGVTWNKKWRSYDTCFFELMDTVGSELKFITSVQHKLETLRPALCRILVGRHIDPTQAGFKENFAIMGIDDRRDSFMKHLRENFFNELVHKNDGTDTFLKLAFAYLLQLYRDMEDVYGNSNQTADEAINSLYAALRFIQFINQPDHNDEEE